MRIFKDLFTPEMNDGKSIFVFGSNLAGRHGAGAAKEALLHWGAIHGQGEGPQGQSYALPTKDADIQTLPLKEIRKYVGQFAAFVNAHPELTFLITKIGCGLAGYKEEQIEPLFEGAPDNCVLPIGWWRPPDHDDDDDILLL